MVLKQLSLVLHVIQTAWLQWPKALDNLGVVEGLMITIHAYTGDQMILDGSTPWWVTEALALAANIVLTQLVSC